MNVKELKEIFIKNNIFTYSPQVGHLVPSYSVYKKWIKENNSEELENFYSKFHSSKEFFYAVFNELDSPPLCPFCGKPRNYNETRRFYSKTCGDSECALKAHEDTMLHKYGVKHTFEVEKTKEKIKKTFNEKWGVDNPGQSKEIRKKKENTNLKKYGSTTPFGNKKIKEKIQKNNILKYGGTSPFCSAAVQHKADITMLEKYGVKNALQFHDFFQKASRVRYIFEGENYDSSWELAYKIYAKEVLNQEISRNFDKKFNLDDSEYIYIPDFF